MTLLQILGTKFFKWLSKSFVWLTIIFGMMTVCVLYDISPDIALLTWKESIPLILASVSLVLVVFRIYQLDIRKKAEHERKRKQSTIEYVTQLRNSSLEIRKKIRKKMEKNGDVLDYEDLDHVMKNEVREFMCSIEYFCVGINSGLYDFEIFNRMAGAYYLNIAQLMIPYIEKIQADQLTAYVEFEAVSKRIEKVLKERDAIMEKFKEDFINPGNLKYS